MQIQTNVGPVSPGLVHYTGELLFNDLWLRPDLAPRDRSLVTLSALIASGQVAQIPFHLNRAMDKGLARAQASEVIPSLSMPVGPTPSRQLPSSKTSLTVVPSSGFIRRLRDRRTLSRKITIDGARTRATVKSHGNKLITGCSIFRSSPFANHGPFPPHLSENDRHLAGHPGDPSCPRRRHLTPITRD